MSIAIMRIEGYKLLRQPMTWILLSISLGLLCLFFYRICVDYLYLMQQALNQRTLHTSVFVGIIKPLCSWALVIFALLVPIFTTHAFSQEFRFKTFTLWAMSPWRALEIVLGKFLSIFCLLFFILSFIALMIMTLGLETPLEWKTIVLSLFSIGLVGCCLISFGLFISSIIPHPLLAIGISFISNILLLLLEWLNPFPHQWEILGHEFSLLSHSYHALNGFFYSPDFLFYFLFILFWLSLTQRIIAHKMIQVT